jgi:flagellar protein FliO/FliZ
MKPGRHAAVLALLFGAACLVHGADRAGPGPSEVIYPRGAAGAPPAESEARPADLVPSLGTGAMPTLAYVVALLGLGVGAWLVLKRGSFARPASKGGGRLQVLETRMLGNRQFLIVVEYDDARMLLGVGPGRIDYLTPLTGHPLAPAPAAGEMAEPFFPAVAEELRR